MLTNMRSVNIQNTGLPQIDLLLQSTPSSFTVHRLPPLVGRARTPPWWRSLAVCFGDCWRARSPSPWTDAGLRNAEYADRIGRGGADLGTSGVWGKSTFCRCGVVKICYVYGGLCVFFCFFCVCVCLKGHVPGLQVNCFGN